MSSQPALTITAASVDAVVFDLDGVVTKTAAVHAAAWKRLFDDFLRRHAAETGTAQSDFDIGDDYLRHVDGKPRLDGVRDFLASRGIVLPDGSPDDADDARTVEALGRRKNAAFQAEIAEHGVDAYASTVDLIRSLRRSGIRTALISASRNAQAVLKAAGLADLFDAVVDGAESARIGIAGKPKPDIFIEAARRLGVDPQRAIVVEDAVAGVEAGRAGGFAGVVGVDRGGNRDRLAAAGATQVVADLSEIAVAAGTDARTLPSALDRVDDIVGLAGATGRRPAIFLDYDGTLTPIVPRPEDAVLAADVRDTVERLSRVATVAVISGRDLADVRSLVGVDGIVYAGSHGFDIAGPQAESSGGSERDRFLPLLEQAEGELRSAVAGVAGATIERKRYSIAIHYRNVADADLAALETVVADALKRHPTLRDLPGKKVHDLQPRIDWDKGKALLHLLRVLDIDRDDVLPVYIGDDITDEDAFAVLHDRGVGIVVREEPRPTAATLAVDSPAEVAALLATLLSRLEGGAR